MTNTKNTPINLNIERIYIEKLFGYYTYDINLIHSVDGSNLLILYGNNGCGKTTILKLIYHLLSYPHFTNQGHLTHIANVPLKKFEIHFTNGLKLRVKDNLPKKDQSKGSYILEYEHNNKVNSMRVKYTIEEDGSRVIWTSDDAGDLDSYDYFALKISKLINIGIYMITDERQFLNDEFDRNSSHDEKYTKYYLESRFRLSDRISEISNLSLHIKRSIDRAKISLASTIGIQKNIVDLDINEIYLKILTSLNTESQDIVLSAKQRNEIIKGLNELERRNDLFAKYNIFSEIELKPIIRVLKKQNLKTFTLSYSVLKPYIDGIISRLVSLSEIY